MFKTRIIPMFVLLALLWMLPAPGMVAFAEDGVQSFDRAVSGALNDVGREVNKAGRKAGDTVNNAARDVDRAVGKALKPEKKKKSGRGDKGATGRRGDKEATKTD